MLGCERVELESILEVVGEQNQRHHGGGLLDGSQVAPTEHDQQDPDGQSILQRQ